VKYIRNVFISIIVFLNLSVIGQPLYLNRATEEFSEKNYAEAIELFEKILQKKNNIHDIHEIYKKMGVSYKEINRFETALFYFGKYLELKPYDNKVIIEYGKLLLITGKVKDAKTIFTDLQNKTDDRDKELERLIASCDFSLSELQKKNLPPYKNLESLNSPQSEFGLSFFNNNLFFSSHRYTERYASIYGRINQGYSDIYYVQSDTDSNVTGPAYPLIGEINSSCNEGTICFHEPSHTAFFTRCSEKPDLCRIYKAKYIKGKWVNVEPVKLGPAEYNYAHPAVSGDGKTFYFVSDLPGGNGMKDIWKSPISGTGRLGTPVNLGNTINTPKDELFPSVAGDSILIFASDGHVGMGGLDIYYSIKEDNIYTSPVNIGSPINSTYDDFSLLLKSDFSGGYFCSNRQYKTQSDDIYSFSFNIFLDGISGKVVDSLDFSPVRDVKISYFENNSLKKIFQTDSAGNFNITSADYNGCGDNHQLIFEKQGFLPVQKVIPCSVKDELIIFISDGSNRFHTMEGRVINRQNKAPVEKALVVIKSLRGLRDTVSSQSDGSFYFKKILPDDYIILRAQKTGFLRDSKTFETPDKYELINLNPKTGYNTEIHLIPIIKEIEYEIKNIYYDFDKAILRPESKTSLLQLVNLLYENPGVSIQINSHTDERGTEKYNLGLSHRRSRSVVNFLKEYGINGSRLVSKGFGESILAIENAKTEEQHQKNRRTTFQIIDHSNDLNGISYPENNSQMHNSNINDSLWLKKLKTAVSKGETISFDSLNELRIKELQKIFNQDQDYFNIAGEVSAKRSTKTKSGIYSVQITATRNIIDLKKKIPHLVDLIDSYNLDVIQEDGLFKYHLGKFTNHKDAEQLKSLLNERGIYDCFVIMKSIRP
jgi:outer membrane protein OmpA-like peptidoglycan-associated protein/tetratricopeptide (TPR) repeat protein